MTAPLHTTPGIRWHHRVLGAFWGLVGLFFVAFLFERDFWEDHSQWISFSLATALVLTAIGLFSGRTWARRTMGVLMVPVALLFFNAMVPASLAGNHKQVWVMKIGLGAVAYTWVFLAIPQVYNSDYSR